MFNGESKHKHIANGTRLCSLTQPVGCRLEFAWQHKDWTIWSNGSESCDLMTPDFPCPSVGHISVGHIRVKREAVELMHLSCLVPTVQESGGRSRLSNSMCSKNGISWLPEYYWMTRLFNQWIFFLPWWHIVQILTPLRIIGMCWRSKIKAKCGPTKY